MKLKVGSKITLKDRKGDSHVVTILDKKGLMAFKQNQPKTYESFKKQFYVYRKTSSTSGARVMPNKKRRPHTGIINMTSLDNLARFK